MKFHHIPVMVDEVVKVLNPKKNEIIVDGTVGGGGHLKALKSVCPTCEFIAIDQDSEAIEAARQRVGDDNTTYIHDNFRNIVLILKKLGIKQIDGILLDLGVSTHQLETDYRGFSFNLDAPLDMRMNQRNVKCQMSNVKSGMPGFCAASLVNGWSQHEIAQVLSRLGQEPFARPIALAIVRQRQKRPIMTTGDLVGVIRQATPPGYRYSRAKIHFATNTFRALRMAVNDELGALESLVKQVPQALAPGGRIAIVTFHSLEDRLVKKAMRSWQGEMRDLNPSDQEIAANPKARSARLRVFSNV